MSKVDIKIQYQCNNRCEFCVQGDKREIFQAKSQAEVKKYLNESFRKRKRGVVFTGGEPTLHPDLLEMVRTAKKIGFKEIQVQTNGRMFAYMDFCVASVRAGAKVFSPALHGPTAKIHDSLTRAKGSFKQTVEGIKNLKKLKQYISTNTVITSQNYKYLPGIARLLVKLGVDQFQFAFVHILGTADKNKKRIVPRKSAVMSYVKKGLDIGIKAGRAVTTEAIPYCLMGGYEDCIAEKNIPDTRVYDAGPVMESYDYYRKAEGKVRTKKCKKCAYFGACEGPWKEYVEIFGWDEFKPVK